MRATNTKHEAHTRAQTIDDHPAPQLMLTSDGDQSAQQLGRLATIHTEVEVQQMLWKSCTGVVCLVVWCDGDASSDRALILIDTASAHSQQLPKVE